MTKPETPSERSAERVETALGKEMMPKLELSKEQAREMGQSHKCDQVKLPRMKSQLERLSFHGHQHKRESHQPLKVDAITPSTPKYHNLLCHVMEMDGDKLAKERVMEWKLKEYQFAMRNLKALKHRLSSSSSQHAIVPIKSASTHKGELDESWMHFKDEKLFAIDRVIKYLTDFK